MPRTNFSTRQISKLRQELENMQLKYRLLCEGILAAEDENQMVALAEDGLQYIKGKLPE